MHKLNRLAVQAPICLQNYHHPSQQWDDLHSDCKEEIRAALSQMQSSLHLLCAYCEGPLYASKQSHIEHFRRKGPRHFPELTFAWDNLFLSCNSTKHCGHYKDRPTAAPYDPGDLIKPDEHDPDEYLFFHSSGVVHPREHIHSDKKRFAEETIRVFGLNHGALQGARMQACKTIKDSILSELDFLSALTEEERNEYLQQEIEANQHLPFATTIKHFLESHY